MEMRCDKRTLSFSRFLARTLGNFGACSFGRSGRCVDIATDNADYQIYFNLDKTDRIVIRTNCHLDTEELFGEFRKSGLHVSTLKELELERRTGYKINFRPLVSGGYLTDRGEMEFNRGLLRAIVSIDRLASLRYGEHKPLLAS